MNAAPAVATHYNDYPSNEDNDQLEEPDLQAGEAPLEYHNTIVSNTANIETASSNTQPRTHRIHEDRAHVAGAEMMQPLEIAGTAGSSLQTAPEEVERARPSAGKRVKFSANNVAITKYVLPWRTANRIHRLRVPNAQIWYSIPWTKCTKEKADSRERRSLRISSGSQDPATGQSGLQKCNVLDAAAHAYVKALRLSQECRETTMGPKQMDDPSRIKWAVAWFNSKTVAVISLEDVADYIDVMGRRSSLPVDQWLRQSYSTPQYTAVKMSKIPYNEVIHIIGNSMDKTNADLQSDSAHKPVEFSVAKQTKQSMLQWATKAASFTDGNAGGCISEDQLDILSVSSVWIFDSGASDDLIGESQLQQIALDNIDSTRSVEYRTAGGRVSSSGTLHLKSGQMFNCSVPVNVLKDSPALISMGRRVLQDKMSFVWITGHSPVLIDQAGNFLIMDVRQNAPEISARSKKGNIKNQACIESLHSTAGVFPKGNTFRSAKCFAATAAPTTKEMSTQTEPTIAAPAVEQEDEDQQQSEAPRQLDPDDLAQESEEYYATTRSGQNAEEEDRQEGANSSSSSAGNVPPPPPPYQPSEAGGPVGLSDSEVDDETLTRRTMREMALTEEHLRTHTPALPDYCEVCRRAKRAQKKKLAKQSKRQPTKFGDIITCDHILMKDIFGYPGVGGAYDALVMLDRYTSMLSVTPVKSMDTMDTYRAMKYWIGDSPSKNVELLRQLQIHHQSMRRAPDKPREEHSGNPPNECHHREQKPPRAKWSQNKSGDSRTTLLLVAICHGMLVLLEKRRRKEWRNVSLPKTARHKIQWQSIPLWLRSVVYTSAIPP